MVLTARNLLIDADGIAEWHGFGADDRLMCVLPIHHVNGTVVTLVTPFYFGGLAVSLLLSRGSNDVSRIYAFDLVGAGLGCAAIAIVMPLFGGSGSVIIASIRGPIAVGQHFPWSWGNFPGTGFRGGRRLSGPFRK